MRKKLGVARFPPERGRSYRAEMRAEDPAACLRFGHAQSV